MTTWRIDQSGKWEESCPTVIGICNHHQYSVLIQNYTKSNVKKYLYTFEQEKNRSNTMKRVRMFAYSVFLALRGYFREDDDVIIDKEYEGHDDKIRDLLICLFKRFENLTVKASAIRFECVGRDSECHRIAKQTFIGAVKPEKELRLDNFFDLLDKTEKIHKRAFEKRRRKKYGQATGFKPAQMESPKR